MADDAQELFHAAMSFTQSKLIRPCLCMFPLELCSCKDQCRQSRNGSRQGHFMRGVRVPSTAVIDAQHTNQAFLDTDGSHQNRPYIIGKDSGVERQGHPLEDKSLTAFEV